MTIYERGRVNLWSGTGLLDKCETIEDKIKVALQWEEMAKCILGSGKEYSTMSLYRPFLGKST